MRMGRGRISFHRNGFECQRVPIFQLLTQANPHAGRFFPYLQMLSFTPYVYAQLIHFNDDDVTDGCT